MLSAGPYLFISVVHLCLAHAYFFRPPILSVGLYFGIFFLQFSDPHIYFSFTQRFLLFFAVYCLSSYIERSFVLPTAFPEPKLVLGTIRAQSKELLNDQMHE